MPLNPEEILAEFDDAMMKLRALLRRIEPLTENQYTFIANRLAVVGIDLKLATRRSSQEQEQDERHASANEGTIEGEPAA